MDCPGFGLSHRPERYRYTAGEHAEIVGKLVHYLQFDRLTPAGGEGQVRQVLGGGRGAHGCCASSSRRSTWSIPATWTPNCA